HAASPGHPRRVGQRASVLPRRRRPDVGARAAAVDHGLRRRAPRHAREQAAPLERGDRRPLDGDVRARCDTRLRPHRPRREGLRLRRLLRLTRSPHDLQAMKTIAVAVLSLVLSSAAAAQDVSPTLPIVPTPVSIRLTTGRFTLGPSVAVRASAADAATAEFLRAHLREAWRDAGAPRAASSGAITLTAAGSEALPPEGYRLTITPTGVTIVGRGAGLFYGVQSLLQLIPANPRGAVAL